jgi:hypothetical protein
VHVDRLAVELPRHDSGETVVEERAEETLAARSKLFLGFRERRNCIGADQFRFDPVGTSLKLKDS